MSSSTVRAGGAVLFMPLALGVLGACAVASAPGASQALTTQPPESGANAAPPSSGIPAPGSLVPLDDPRYGAYRYAPRAPTLGDVAPDFDLPTQNAGERFVLSQALQTSDVMVIFYRGFW